MNGQRIQPHHLAGAAFALIAGLGWWRHSIVFALVGVAGLLATAGTQYWANHCLDEVSYRRALRITRAAFGEEIPFEIELVNDKLLPLTWLHLNDHFPSGLTLRGATLVTGRSEFDNSLVQVVPLLPYQRIRRRMTVLCDRRGAHVFGPAELSSGDPFGYRRQFRRVPGELEVVVYPKIFALEPVRPASRLPLGEQRTHALLGDPSRVAGIREYRTGDPLRTVDWRATARSTTLLVREFEPTTFARAAVFANFQPVRAPGGGSTSSVVEFVVALAASIVTDLATRGTGVGLFTTGSVRGQALAHPPSSAPSALAEMLDGLARVNPHGGVPFADVLHTQGVRLAPSTSVVVIGSHFSDETLVALAELRRRTSLTAVWVDAGVGLAPAPESVDAWFRVEYTDDWQQRTIVELAA